ncbi:GNAT family N-acetyltransferase [Rhodobium gokarnense]|uniref:RimJ/RimL family protein N-acetyltransferase n=1 Tax=Rhodobium gokarnense TaxID=364296 RepID=A0ABT3HEI8_9HYPH|nr:GNAT family N-acetyltransferase [Rhodobium gokarnense]MCW2308823.1 RimJ/RimL family protein N-acetyltransferase [Rhodobium gokarnense]
MCTDDGLEDLESEDDLLLTTDRLELAPPRHEDAETIAAVVNDRRIAEMAMSIPYPYGVEDAHRWIEEKGAGKHPALGKFLIWTQPDGNGARHLVGACGVVEIMEEKEIHIGYWIGVPFWGKGFATEAAHRIIDHVFESTDLTEINAACRVTNPASRRVIEKCGFQFRANGIIYSLGAAGIVSVERFVLERPVWAALKAW